jgi:elongation factor P--(R)-beta-lysine ligase
MPEQLSRMRRRAAVTRAIRAFFEAKGFVEVDTPVAQTALAPEAHIEAPAVTLRASQGLERRYLQTSPELLMKRLLALGLPKIFQIAPAFRDGDFTRLHRPEFRLLEWYRRDADWTELMDDCEELVLAAAAAAGVGGSFSYAGKSVNLRRPFRRVSVDEAFIAHAGFSILEALEHETLLARLEERGVHCSADDSWDDLFHRIFLSRVEPALLASSDPLFLTHYPAPLAALARSSPTDRRVAERFELYVGGLELANAFGELVDASEQRQRFGVERQRRALAGMHDYPLDERFFTALATLPPSAGIALGLERLLMVLFDVPDIDDVAFIAWSQS